MNKDAIKKKYKEKIKLYKLYNKKYYSENIAKITDAKFDLLKKEINEIEKKFDFLNDEDSPSKNVGYKPSKHFKKILHRAPMLSLANAFDENDLVNFEKKILNFILKKNNFKISYSAEPKIDGISASLSYKNGKFISYDTKTNILSLNKGKELILDLKDYNDNDNDKYCNIVNTYYSENKKKININNNNKKNNILNNNKTKWKFIDNTKNGTLKIYNTDNKYLGYNKLNGKSNN